MNPTTTYRHRWLILVALCALMLLPGLGQLPVVRQQELRVILAAREMADGGDWLIPHYGGEIRVNKPPLMYWMVAGAMKLADPIRTSPLVARLTGVIFSTLLVLLVYRGGALFIGRRRAFMAAIIAASTYLFIRHARLAETDITFSFFISLATLFGYAAMTRRDPWRFWLGAGLSMGLGFMIKGPAALALPVLAWITFALAKRGQFSRALVFRVLAAIALCAVIAVPWYLAVFLRTGQGGELAGRISAELTSNYVNAHRPEPFYYYLYMIPEWLLPWGLLLPWALWGMFRRARHHQGTRFLLAWFASSFLVLSLNPGKREHYITLLLTPSVLILGWFASRLSAGARNGVGRFMAGLLGLVGLAGAALVVLPFMKPEIPTAGPVLFGAAVVLVCVVFIRRQERVPLALAAAFGMALIGVESSTTLNVFRDGRTLLPELVEQARPYINAAPSVYVVGPNESALEFYTHRTLISCADPDIAWAQAGARDVIIMTANRKHPWAESDIQVAPALEASRCDVRCQIFVKPAPDA